MKLDLINSRFNADRGYRIYDSVEGEFIQKPKLSDKTLAKASFLSKQAKADYFLKNEPTPDRFDLAVIDKCGDFIGANKPIKYKESIEAASKPKETISEELSALLNDQSLRFRGRDYAVLEDSVSNRLNSKKLPGALWPVVGRTTPPPSDIVGPGNYDIYKPDLGKHGLTPLKGGKFNDQHSGRAIEEVPNPEFFPLKERKRLLRIKLCLEEIKQSKAKIKAPRSPSPNKNTLSCSSISMVLGCLDEATSKLSIDVSATADNNHTSINSNESIPPAAATTTAATVDSNMDSSCMSAKGVIKFSAFPRFDDPIYRQEKYIKTSGMLLSNDWDKKLEKKILFSFQPGQTFDSSNNKSPPRGAVGAITRGGGGMKTEGADVDVDIGHMFSLSKLSELSPVKYSAAFK